MLITEEVKIRFKGEIAEPIVHHLANTEDLDADKEELSRQEQKSVEIGFNTYRLSTILATREEEGSQIFGASAHLRAHISAIDRRLPRNARL
jgi:hypothetical protein